MRIAFLAATVLVAFLPQVVAQDQIDAAIEPTSKAKPINPDSTTPNGRLHYDDVPCRVSSVGTCITVPPPYRPMKK